MILINGNSWRDWCHGINKPECNNGCRGLAVQVASFRLDRVAGFTLDAQLASTGTEGSVQNVANFQNSCRSFIVFRGPSRGGAGSPTDACFAQANQRHPFCSIGRCPILRSRRGAAPRSRIARRPPPNRQHAERCAGHTPTPPIASLARAHLANATSTGSARTSAGRSARANDSPASVRTRDRAT